MLLGLSEVDFVLILFLALGGFLLGLGGVAAVGSLCRFVVDGLHLLFLTRVEEDSVGEAVLAARTFTLEVVPLSEGRVAAPFLDVEFLQGRVSHLVTVGFAKHAVFPADVVQRQLTLRQCLLLDLLLEPLAVLLRGHLFEVQFL